MTSATPTPPAAAALDGPKRQYAANLACLYRSDTKLAARIDALPFESCPGLELSRDGNYTARLTSDEGRDVYVHSRYRPLEESEKFVAAQAESDSPAFIISGLGLGYHITCFDRRYDRPVLIVLEDDLSLLKAALCVSDFTTSLRERRLIFITDDQKASVYAALRDATTDVLLGLQFVTLPYAERRRVEFQRAVHKIITDFVAYSRMQMVTLLRNARATVQNVLYNLSDLAGAPGVEALENAAAGYPAIIVAAGPSLARNVDQLPPLRDKAVVIAVQTVFKNLLARGVPPHFVTSLDFHEISARFFEGVEDTRGTTLVAEAKANWRVLDAFQGQRRVVDDAVARRLLGDAYPKRGELKGGTTVAHLCFYLARYLGCDPIIFIGQDLSFTEAMYYAPGMPIEKLWLPELHRFDTVENRQWERIVRSRAILRPVVDLHGRPAYTDDQMFTYAEQFENDFTEATCRIIQASEGGLALRGAEVMTLREAAERYCTRPLPAGVFEVAEAAVDRAGTLQDVRGRLDERLAQLREMARVARETRRLLEQLATLVERPAEFNRVVGRVDEMRTRMLDYEEMYRTVVAVSQAAELRRYSADRRMGEVERETADVARRRLTRDREFVTSFIDGCDFLEDVLVHAVERLERRPS